MALYLGGDSVDLKLGTKTLLLSAIYLHDLTAYYQKPETYGRDELVNCINGLLSSIQSTYYSKAEISAILRSFEVEYGLDFKQEKSGDIQLANRVSNIVTPSADVNLIMPRTIINSNQLGRDFFVQIQQPSEPVNVTFSGYEGETLKFKVRDGEDLEEMEGGQHYNFYFIELCASTFEVTQHKLAYSGTLSSEQEVEESNLSTYWLVDNQVNYISMTEDCRFVFPAMQADVSGNVIPRDFMLYMKQSTVSAYDFEFIGRDNECITLKVDTKELIGGADIGSENLYCFSELERDGLSSTFVAKQIPLADSNAE